MQLRSYLGKLNNDDGNAPPLPNVQARHHVINIKLLPAIFV